MAKKYTITLTKEERKDLEQIISKGKHSSQIYRNAYILLNKDEGAYSDSIKVTNQEVSKVLKIAMRTIDRIKKRFVEEGFEACLSRKPTTRVYERKIDGDREAKLISIACSEPPQGMAKWSLRLLADKMVELNYVDSLSHETVRSVLKKNELKPWRVKGWVIPPIQNADFVANMEHVLDVYKRPYCSKHPVVCMDESPKQLIDEIKDSIKLKDGSKIVDYEYKRNGVCNIFMANEPFSGKRIVKITERKTKKDWALFVKDIAEQYKEAEKITLVMDNLNTHKASSLYQTFKPEQAKQLWDRFEFVYTPKYGSWLNMAEIELNVLNGQCLNRRIDHIETVKTEVGAWVKYRDQKQATINWQFTTKDSCIKLKRLYPTLNN
ncbi:IS630 family transposase [Polaribacter cellanae]|uniref:IS630 family transposase n=1 Tax=Polaribacter cellanae TaxID=2818493 RepID=A0A975H7L9_9FLAO|nr:IS630 family transposase [Polaribacter cellanae]QTE23612.1 IS630 family transposase [Polaribacter cellanae]